MADTLFFSDRPLLAEGPFALGGEEALHAIRVLRMKTGDRIGLTDGHGALAEARIVHLEKRSLALVIEGIIHSPPEPYPVHIAVAPTKNIDRYEWFLEKATETGVSEVTPLLCEHSERRVVKEERSLAVLVAALKQSRRSWLPRLNPLTKFQDLVKSAESPVKYIALGSAGLENHVLTVHRSAAAALVLIGPEGDFSPAEVALAESHAFRPINLGPQRLRTETAALTASILLTTLNLKP